MGLSCHALGKRITFFKAFWQLLSLFTRTFLSDWWGVDGCWLSFVAWVPCDPALEKSKGLDLGNEVGEDMRNYLVSPPFPVCWTSYSCVWFSLTSSANFCQPALPVFGPIHLCSPGLSTPNNQSTYRIVSVSGVLWLCDIFEAINYPPCLSLLLQYPSQSLTHGRCSVRVWGVTK